MGKLTYGRIAGVVTRKGFVALAAAIIVVMPMSWGLMAIPAVEAHADQLAATSIASRPENPSQSQKDFQYMLGYELLKTGTQDASHVNGVFDAHVKLVRANGTQTISLLVPAGANARGDVVGDVLQDVAIRTGEDDGGNAVCVSATRTVTDEGVEFSGLPVANIAQTQELLFGLEGSGYHNGYTKGAWDSYKKADLVFTSLADWWPGYAAQAPVDLPDGLYALDIETRYGGSVDHATDTTSFTVPLMGDNVFGNTMWLSVKNGEYTAMLNVEPVVVSGKGRYVRNIRAYARTGMYSDDSLASNALVEADVLGYQRNDDGSLIYDDYDDGEDVSPSTVSFNLPGKGAVYYSFLRLQIPSGAPFDVVSNPFVPLMRWDSLRKVSAPDTAKLEAAIAAAKECVKADYETANWTSFKDLRDAARETLRSSSTLNQTRVDAAAEALANAQKALVKSQSALDREAAQPVQDKIEALPAVDALTASDKAVVAAARAAYDKLTESQKALVGNADALAAAEERVAALEQAAKEAVDKAAADKAAANSVSATIQSLPAKAKLQLSDAKKVAAARAAYDELTGAQKALVGNVSTLTAAESRIAALKAADVKAAKGQKLAGVRKAYTKKHGAKAFKLGITSSYAGAKLSYKSSNARVATVSAKGKVTVKVPGKAVITATAKATACDGKTYTKTAKATVNVTLAAPKLTKATRSAKPGKLTAAWKKVAGAQGYQVKVTSAGKAKTYSVQGAAKLKKTVAAVKGEKAQVRVRAFSSASGKKVWSSWSAAKTVKVKE